MGKEPFPSGDLYLALGKSLKQTLDSEFESYCDDDDYYQPVVEDFEAEEYMKNWAKERNLEVVQFDGSGSDGGYKQKMRWR